LKGEYFMSLKRIALFAVAGALVLGGCSGGNDEPVAPTNNAENMTPIEVGNTAVVPAEAPAATPIDNVTITPQPATVPSDLSTDEQTQDDADATGMTARVSRDEGNEAQPAQ
jgi:PBP1b-binding outer membrane lipoprotein LpoB